LGTIARQTIQNSLFSYLGVVLGGINIAILYPRIFSEEQVGLVNVLLAVSAMFAQLSSLGVNGVTNYFFHHFRDKASRHKGYFTIIALVIFTGYLLFLIVFGLFKDQILSSKVENSFLLGKYGVYIFPITFFTLSFLVTDIYAAVLSKSVIGVFMQELVFRCCNLVLSLLFLFNVIDFSLFLFLYVLALGLPPIVIVIQLYRTGNVSFQRPDRSLLSLHGLKMISVGAFYVLSGFGGMLITYIDKYMINLFLGLGPTGIYSISNYVGTLVQIPRRAMGKVAASSLAGLWSKKDITQLQEFYHKSVVSQLAIGVLIFIGIWVNIDAVFQILPESYESGKWVIFYIGLANVFQCALGLGGVIVVTSKYYRLNTYLTFILGILAIGTNILFIPVWGITGAAFASTLSKFIYIGINMFVINYKLNIRPVRIEHFTIPLCGIISYFLVSLFDPEWNWFNVLIIKSLFITIVYILFLKLFRVIPNFRKFLSNF
jgi:O-antigen/teichoic acid export membrane protein